MGRKKIFTSFPLIGKPCDNLGSDLGQNSFFSNVFKHIPSCFAGSYNTLLDNGESLVDRFAYFGACHIPHNTSNEATDNWANNGYPRQGSSTNACASDAPSHAKNHGTSSPHHLFHSLRQSDLTRGNFHQNLRFLYKGIIINHNKNRANLH